MVKHCVYGHCHSDSRYPEKLRGAKFIPFVKPTQDLQRCLRWIALCGRPNTVSRPSTLTPQKISKHTYICSKHFYNGEGPTDDYPDPCDAISGEFKKARTALTYWHSGNSPTIKDSHSEGSTSTTIKTDVEMAGYQEQHGTSVQTEETLFSSMDMLSYASRIHELEQENRKLHERLDVQKEISIVRQTMRVAFLPS